MYTTNNSTLIKFGINFVSNTIQFLLFLLCLNPNKISKKFNQPSRYLDVIQYSCPEGYVFEIYQDFPNFTMISFYMDQLDSILTQPESKGKRDELLKLRQNLEPLNWGLIEDEQSQINLTCASYGDWLPLSVPRYLLRNY